MKILKRGFYLRDPKIVAEELLGMLLIREISNNKKLSGIIVETEAYLAKDDLAAHSNRGITNANKSIFLDGGHSYVHSIHAYHCLDIVCQSEGNGGSVLIRALEPVDGIDVMKKNRNRQEIKDLTSGPGKLCISLDINKELDGVDLTDTDTQLQIYDTGDKKFNTLKSIRIGISKSKEFEFRFYIEGNQFVSR